MGRTCTTRTRRQEIAINIKYILLAFLNKELKLRTRQLTKIPAVMYSRYMTSNLLFNHKILVLLW